MLRIRPMKRVLDQVLASVDGRRPVWMGEPDDFVQRSPSARQRSSIVPSIAGENSTTPLEPS